MPSLVDGGELRLVGIQAVPRSLSTALGRSLNEADGHIIFVNEPFNTPTADADSAAGHVLAWAESVLSSASSPLTVVSKNMARNVSPGAWAQWQGLCSAVVWCVRDPRVQISSLVTRTANDLLFGLGADRLAQDDLEVSHLEMVNDFLLRSPASTDFSKTGWRAIGDRFASYPENRRRLVADMALCSRFPEEFVRYVCAGVGLRFDARMLGGWTADFLNVNRTMNPGLPDASDAWISAAATSSGVQVPRREPLDPDVLPAGLRHHLNEVATPVYQRFMRELTADLDESGIRLELSCR